MSIAPKPGIVEFGTFVRANATTDGIQGEVPGPPSPAASSRFLREDGEWVTVGGGGGGVAISAGTNSTSTGTVVFSNANNITFGMDTNGVVTGSVVPPSGAAINISAGTTSTAAGAFTFSNANGVAFGLGTGASAGVITGSVATNYMASNASTQFVQAGAAFNGTNASGTIASNAVSVSVAPQTAFVLSASNGVSFGTNGSTVTATVATNYMASNASTNFAATGFTTTTTAGAVVAGTQDTAGLKLAVPAYLTTARASNDAIGTNTAQSNVTWTVNSAGLSLDARGYAGTGFTGTNVSGTVNSNGVQLSVGAGGGLTNINVSAGTTSNNLSALTFDNAGGVSFGLSGSVVTAAAPAGGGGITNINVSAGTTSNNLSKLTFADSNGLAFGLNGSTITGSYTQSTHSHRTEFQAMTLLGNTAGTTTFNATNNDTLFFAGGNNITLSGNGSTVTIVGPTTVAQTTQSAIKGFGVSNTGQTAGNTGVSTGVDWVLAGSQSITLSQSTAAGGPNTVWVQHPAWITTARASTDAVGLNTAQSNVTWTANSSGLSLDARGYAGTGTSATNASVTLNSNGLQISVGAGGGTAATFYATSNTTQSSTGTMALSSLMFAGAGIASVGVTNGSVVVSVPSGGGAGDGVNIIQAGTTGTTGTTFSSISGTVFLNGSGGLTVSQNNSNQIVLSAPATSSIVGANGISVSTAGNTISVQPAFMSAYENLPGIFGSQTMTLNGASISHAVSFNLPENISASFMRIPVLMTTASATATTLASATASANAERYSTWNAVVYSQGTGASSQSLTSVAKGSVGFTHRVSVSITNSSQGSYTHAFSANVIGGGTTFTTQYSVSAASYSVSNDGVYSSFSSNRYLDINFANSLQAGNYWMVFGYSSSSASSGAAGLSGLTAAQIGYSNHYGASQPNLSFGLMGSSNMTSSPLGAGSFSTAGGGTTAGFPQSAISSSASHVRPYFLLLRSA